MKKTPTLFEKKIDESIINKIRESLYKGNSIEIHPAKNGVKIYEVKKKLI